MKGSGHAVSRGMVGTLAGSFSPNGFGLHDMAGNVSEWTTEWCGDRHRADTDKPCCVLQNSATGPQLAVLKLLIPV